MRVNMSIKDNLTNNSDEYSFTQLLSRDWVFSIPFFQRDYRWDSKKIDQLNVDILNIVYGIVENHFFGAIIVHGKDPTPDHPDIFQVIDGQQRLTTIYLYIAAIIRVLVQKQEYKQAGILFDRFMKIGFETDIESNLKLHTSLEDRLVWNQIVDDVISSKRFMESIKNPEIRKYPSYGRKGSKLLKNYNKIKKWLLAQINSEGNIDIIFNIRDAVMELIKIVYINVKHPENGPVIFNSLNVN